MAPPRIEIVGAIYHVNSKAVHGAKLFDDESDRALFLRLLHGEARRSEWCVLAYSLMTNHFHLLLRLAKPTLSSGFQHLNCTLRPSLQPPPRAARSAVATALLRLDDRDRGPSLRGDQVHRTQRATGEPVCSPGGLAVVGLWVGDRPFAGRPSRRRARAASSLCATSERGTPAPQVASSKRPTEGPLRSDTESDSCQTPRSETTSLCNAPFVLTKLWPGVGAAPAKVVQRPPASSTSSCTAA